MRHSIHLERINSHPQKIVNPTNSQGRDRSPSLGCIFVREGRRKQVTSVIALKLPSEPRLILFATFAVKKFFTARDARHMPKSAKNTHELPWIGIGIAPLLRAFTAMGVILSGSRFSGEAKDLAPTLESFPQELSRTSR
jgi:hypothetical protein